MENMNNPYGRASASPRQASLPPVATQKNSASSIKRGEAGGVGVSSIKREDAGGVGVEPWSDMKLEKKRSIIKREAKPRGQGSSDALRVTTKQQDPRDDLIDDLKSDLEKLRKSCICSICQELLFEPYFFQCGHVYCYGVSCTMPAVCDNVLMPGAVYHFLDWAGKVQEGEILPTV